MSDISECGKSLCGIEGPRRLSWETSQVARMWRGVLTSHCRPSPRKHQVPWGQHGRCLVPDEAQQPHHVQHALPYQQAQAPRELLGQMAQVLGTVATGENSDVSWADVRALSWVSEGAAAAAAGNMSAPQTCGTPPSTRPRDSASAAGRLEGEATISLLGCCGTVGSGSSTSAGYILLPGV